MESVKQQVSEDLELAAFDETPKFLYEIQKDMCYRLMLWHTIKHKLLGDKNV